MKRFLGSASLMAAIVLTGILPASADFAVAIHQTGKDAYSWGTAWNYSTLADARKHALSNCKSETGKPCKVVSEGSGGCLALSFGINDNAYGWAKAQSKRQAAQNSLNECVKYSKSDCEVKDAFCEE